ncbi:hypothetical protein K2173_005926 [Erythroxylum novogranatense]|uniref:Uncharacterized protein n=1 Tax=Erythroxylum novogranatense TaxID=1862640 RepID=A0AAV8U371_9ROSI|nr:hypothetical protein K2173_005926 [Erythroxylum novogranatense]
MKIKNKGKVFPSPSSSSAAADGQKDVFSILKLLPTAIFALASVLSLEDREVLAYMITRSMKTTTNPSSLVNDSKKKPPRKQPNNNTNYQNSTNCNNNHKMVHVFDCDCFDCYTSYWFRWDSSPNRELIHQVIEAFEEHLTNGESRRKGSRGKKKSGRRVDDKGPEFDISGQTSMLSELELLISESDNQEVDVCSSVSPDDVLSADGEVEEQMIDPTPAGADNTEERSVFLSNTPVGSRKGLLRKVLPDVLGLLNSRLWGLLSPNV